MVYVVWAAVKVRPRCRQGKAKMESFLTRSLVLVRKQNKLAAVAPTIQDRFSVGVEILASSGPSPLRPERKRRVRGPARKDVAIDLCNEH